MALVDFRENAYSRIQDRLRQLELRRVKAGDVDEANPTAPVEAEAVETYLARGYIRNRQARASDGRAVDGSEIVIYAASVTGLLGRRTTGGQGVNPWSDAFDASFGGQVVGQDYVPTDTVPREGDTVRFMGETARHQLGILLQSDAAGARLAFAVNLNTS